LAEVERMVVTTLGPVFQHQEFGTLVKAIPVWAIDPASQHKPEIHAFWDDYDVGLVSPPGLHGGKLELEPSLEIIRSWILTGTWMVSDDCQQLIEQIRRYVWKTVKTAGQKNAPVVKEPRKAFDHLIDASRMLDFALEIEGLLPEALPAMTMQAMMEKAQKDRIFGPLRAVLEHAGEIEEAMKNDVWW
jgi:hypothetical protein